MEEIFYRLRVFYDKKGFLRFISHLNTVRIWERALRRAKIPVLYSRGFHPHPKISYGPALPLGFIGRNEGLDISLKEKIPEEKFIEDMTGALPGEIEITAAKYLNEKSPALHNAVKKVIFIVKIGTGEKLTNFSFPAQCSVCEREGFFIIACESGENFKQRTLQESFGKQRIITRQIIWDVL